MRAIVSIKVKKLIKINLKWIIKNLHNNIEDHQNITVLKFNIWHISGLLLRDWSPPLGDSHCNRWLWGGEGDKKTS